MLVFLLFLQDKKNPHQQSLYFSSLPGVSKEPLLFFSSLFFPVLSASTELIAPILRACPPEHVTPTLAVSPELAVPELVAPPVLVAPCCPCSLRRTTLPDLVAPALVVLPNLPTPKLARAA